MKYIAAFLLFFFTTTAFAAPCYTPVQFRAEQAVRYHTQLMIVGMRCQRVLSPTAYADYKTFTLRNQSVIRQQENQMIGFFKQTKKGGERGFHTFRTDLANKISLQANGPGFMSFCKSNAAQLQQAKTMTPKEFQAWINKVDLKQPLSAYPVCSAAKRKQ